MQRTPPSQLTGHRFDLVVIGAGINGAAIARDAAMRGFSVCLLDKEDISSGTTAWATRLIHGGLRYLEHGEVGLVRESLRERERLLRNAPHLVTPLPLYLPIYKGARRGKLLVRLGMLLYDVLSYDKSLDHHHILSRDEALARVPALEPDGLKGAAVYYDAQATYAERLAVENVLSAAAHGAVVSTYAEITKLLTDGAVVRGVSGVDCLTGEPFTVDGKLVVNVAGPWVDQVLAGAPDGAVKGRFIGGTKGSHAVVAPWPGAPTQALYYEARADGRGIFVVPWNGLLLLGTTDLRFQGDLDRVEATDDEIAYLLREINGFLTGRELTPEDILYTYSGIRPLPYRPSGSTAAIPRSHLIEDHAPRLRGLLSIIGGKLTTHRSLAEEVVDHAAEVLGRDVTSRTRSVALPGAAGVSFPAYRDRFVAVSERRGLLKAAAERLVRVYGVRAEKLWPLIEASPDLAEPFDEESGAIGAEVVFAVQSELAQTLSDILLRRTLAAYSASSAIGADERAVAVAARHLGWDAARCDAELTAYRDWITRYRPKRLRTPA